MIQVACFLKAAGINEEGAAFIVRIRILLCAAALALVPGAYSQARKPDNLWAPKYPPTAYTPPHKPITRLKDLLASHKGQTTWREPIVRDDHIWADYVMSPPGSKVSRRLHPDTREWWVVMDGQIRFEIEGQEPFVASRARWCRSRCRPSTAWKRWATSRRCGSKCNIAKAKTLYPDDVTAAQDARIRMADGADAPHARRLRQREQAGGDV